MHNGTEIQSALYLTYITPNNQESVKHEIRLMTATE